MKRILLGILFWLSGFALNTVFCLASTNLTISPIRTEFTIDPGNFSTWVVTLYNWWSEDKDFEVYFEECIRQQNITNCWRYLSWWTVENSFSFWMDIPEWGKKFTLSPKSSKQIQYKITLPQSAKWWVYLGYIKASEVIWRSSDISIDRKIELWTTILLTANTDIQWKLDIWNAIIIPSSWWWKQDRLSHLIYSYFSPFSYKISMQKDESFNVEFDIPIKNSWNTGIEPTGKIEIIDNGTILENVGYKFITNDDKYIIGNEITDYLPINEGWRMILPTEEISLKSEWKWFAYNTIDQNWEAIVQYDSPGQYFSKNSLKGKHIPGFYKFVLKENVKHLTARITIISNTWENIVQEIPFTIKFTWIQAVPNEALFFWLNQFLHFL